LNVQGKALGDLGKLELRGKSADHGIVKVSVRDFKKIRWRFVKTRKSNRCAKISGLMALPHHQFRTDGLQVRHAPLRELSRHSVVPALSEYTDILNIALICIVFVPPSAALSATLHQRRGAVAENLRLNCRWAVAAETAGTCARSAPTWT
jgi:hypothetical protein